MLAWLLCMNVAAQPKREFRGAWIQCVNGQFQGMGTQQMQQTLPYQLAELQKTGVNAIIFQVRPECDALYQSNIEPWSRFLTGQQGRAPQPWWDPLQWMVEQCHRRGMELHAWINPYRAKTKGTTALSTTHIAITHPERCFSYDDLLILNPGIAENRDYICAVAKDIVSRYDVDGIHMDDYFYPYPVTGAEFPDTVSYNQYGIGWDKNDWRRNNVDLLIEQLHGTIQELKPWVRFGISPFGIWRNKASDTDGSETNGLQCYDALYADCLKWTAQGWVDYMVPQLYWELEHKAASDLVLMHWWNDHANGRHMYYGQAVNNVMSHRDIADEGGDTTNATQLDHKLRLQRAMEDVHGVTWWPAYSITGNYKGVLDSLENNQTARPALIPPYTWIDSEKPHRVHDLSIKKVGGKKSLVWRAHDTSDPMQQAVRYVVYRFPKGKKGKLDDAASILTVTGETSYLLPDAGKGKWQYAVTALDRCWNESDPAWK